MDAPSPSGFWQIFISLPFQVLAKSGAPISKSSTPVIFLSGPFIPPFNTCFKKIQKTMLKLS